MSTRAFIDVVDHDTKSKIDLYCGCSAYPSGLGKKLYLFCKAFRDMTDMDSFCMKLIRMWPDDIEMNTFGSDAIADYVYRIEFASGNPVKLTCWEVDWKGDNNRPVRERLSCSIDLETAIYN